MTTQSLGERQPVHVRADGRAGGAVGAVAAQHIAGLHGLLAAAHPIQEAHPHPAGLGLGDAGDFDIAPHDRMRIPLEVGPQHRFQLGLVEHVHLREPVGGAGLGAALDLGQHPHVGVDQPKTQPGPGVRGELVADAQPGQDAVDLVVGVHRPRQRIGGFMAVQHQAVNAVLRQQRRGGDAGRAGTDDDHRHELRHRGRRVVRLRVHEYTTLLRWVPRSMAPSSVATVASTTSPSWR